MNENTLKYNYMEPLEFGFPTSSKNIIKVIGVGGGGGNAVVNMYKLGLNNVSFALANTDSQALEESDIPVKIQMGEGLGAGNDPEVAKRAAEQSIETIKEQFKDGTQMVFITAGMGGGTGTGAAPVVARVAKDMGVLTVGIVTIPFKFEQQAKIRQALKGVKNISEHVDALLVINNERLINMYKTDTIKESFRKADMTLYNATKSISEIITIRGSVNSDFRDVNNVLKDGGVAVMSTGSAKGPNRVTSAIEAALRSPLLYNNDIFNAKKILLNIYQSKNEEYQILTDEMNELTHFMDRFKDKSIEVIWGLADHPELTDEIKITVLATGFGMSDLSLDDEDTTKTMKSFYGESVGKKESFIYEMSDSDLDSDDVINAIESVTVISRTSKDLSRIKDLSGSVSIAAETTQTPPSESPAI